MKDNRTYQILQPLLLAGVLVLGMFIGTQIDDQLPGGDLVRIHQQNEWDEVVDVVQYVRSRYGESLDEDSISEAMIKTLVSHLDPHSYYLSGLEYISFKERMASSYTGIGIDYQVIDDTVTLIRIMENSPAESAQLQIGDQILAIDGTSLADLDKEEAYEVWRETGNQLSLTVHRQGEGIREVEMSKGHIDMPSVPVGLMIDDEVGYVRIERFSNDTYRSFMEYLEPLYNEEGLRKLIIDVRYNPGGSLDQVVKILNQLVVEKDQLMLYMEGIHVKKTEYKSTGKVFFPLEDIVVLINEHSVSASEVLAGVLQDLGVATIVGRRSFGKALVQEMYPVSDESAINLTIGKYYLPSGRFIQKSFEDRAAYEAEIDRRFTSGELFVEDSFDLHDVTMMQTADGVKRPVGEGVVPDVFVAADSFHYQGPWKMIDRFLYLKAFQFLEKNPQLRQQIQKGDFNIEISDDVLLALCDEYSDEYVIDKEQAAKSFVSALVWHAGGKDTYYTYMKDKDPEIKIALELLSNSPS